MLRVTGRILVGGSAGALIVALWVLVFFGVIRPLLWPGPVGFDVGYLLALMFLPPVGAFAGSAAVLIWPRWPSWLAWSDLSPLAGFEPAGSHARSTPPIDIRSLPSYPR